MPFKDKNTRASYMRNRYRKDGGFRKICALTQKISNSRVNYKKRTILMEVLGGKFCKCSGDKCWHESSCNIIDERCLQIDHINGGGLKDIMKHGSRRDMYRYYLSHREEAKRELQVLCANCNWVKRVNNNEYRGNPSELWDNKEKKFIPI